MPSPFKSNLVPALICGTLYCGLAAADPPQPSNQPEAEPKCESPDFRQGGQCWQILGEDEECLVEPIVVELEDQPLFCPKGKTVPATEEHSFGNVQNP